MDPVITEPLRASGVPVDELRPRPGAPAGDVRVALHADVEAERAWVADAVADRWRAAMWAKRPGHGIDDPTFLQPARPMSAIGG